MPEGWELWVLDGDEPPEPTPKLETSDNSTGPGDTAEDLFALKAELIRLRARLADAAADDDVVSLDDQKVLQDVGIYRYHHPLENAAGYQAELERIEVEIAEMVREQAAIEVSSTFTFENSLAAGRTLSSDLGKLMLRAYNAECDNCIRSLRAANPDVAKRRLEASRKAIAKLGRIMEMQIASRYHDLRVREIELTADWLMKKQEEKERARENRARLREEKRIEKEFAEERDRLAKERTPSRECHRSSSGEGREQPRSGGEARSAGRRHRAERLPAGEHQVRLCLRHLEPRGVRSECRQDRPDETA